MNARKKYEDIHALTKLCLPLNVDVELTDNDIAAMQDKITELEEQLAEAKSDVDSAKEEVENFKTRVKDTIEYLKGYLDGEETLDVADLIKDLEGVY